MKNEATTTKQTAEQLANTDFSKVNYVIATDQIQSPEQAGAVVLFDLDKASKSLDDAVVWRYSKTDKCFLCPSGVKFRTGTVYGDVVLIACSGGYAGVISFPEGKELWHVDYCGHNPHSIEILPDGAIVTASSTGNDVRIYPPKSTEYSSIMVRSAHAVLWDPENECIWAPDGANTLFAFKEVVTDGRYTLEEIKRYPIKRGAHECTHDISEPDHLFICVEGEVLHINKNTGAYTAIPSSFGANDCKGFGINRNGNYIYVTISSAARAGAVWEKEYYQSWCTPEINVVYAGSDKPVKFRSDKCAFYKSFVFYGEY